MSETIEFGLGTDPVVLASEVTLEVDLVAGAVVTLEVLVPGPPGLDGTDGIDGVDGAPGTDGAPGADGADGLGVPAGGAAGFVLAKLGPEDNNTAWVGAMLVVAHGADANVARPVGAAAVYWYGTVEPVNAIDIDIWGGGA